MKELSIEQKAQRYDEAIEKAKGVIEQNPLMEYLKKGIEYIFPELAESKDERIRKELLNYLYDAHDDDEERARWIAWLEAQGVKVSAIEGFETEFERQVSGLIASAINKEHEYNQGYVKWTANTLLNYAKHEIEKQGEQKPAYKIEPKFKQGDIIKEKETGNLFYVNSVEEFGYTLHYKNCIAKGCTMDFKYEDNYELVEQKPAWSEEDETKIKSIIALLKSPALCAMDGNKGIIDENIKYLKTIKDRYTWKPSDKELGAILTVIGDERQEGSDVTKELLKVYHHLKKLKS